MLRIYFLQQWFNLSDPAAEDAIYDSESMRRFARVDLGEDAVPDESTILRFRHLLEEHGLTAKIFEEIRGLLEEKRLLLRSGTIVDATIIAAPSSTKNATETRDPEMKQTRKGNNWHFGMKLHIGTDRRGIVHTVVATHAATADITQLPDLLHGQEREVFGDQAYWKEADRQDFEESRCALSDESPSQGEAAAQRAMEADQPRSLANPRGRRASVSSPQTALGLREGPLPGAEKESGPGTDDVCTGQSLPSPTRVAPGRDEVCLVNAKLGRTRAPAHPGVTTHSAIRPLPSRFP
jgi:IS5 family transposase